MIRLTIYSLLLLNIFFSFAQANIWDDKQYLQTNILNGYYEQDILVGIEVKLADGWKIYNHQDQEVGFPSSFTSTDDNIADIKVVFPRSKKFTETDDITSYGYSEKVIFPIYIKLNKELENSKFTLQGNFALCKEVCIPVVRDFTINLPRGFTDKENIKLIKSYQGINLLLLFAIIGGFIAGLILNFMPCILPVLLLKIVSLLEKRKVAKKEIILSSLSTILGIITTFIFLIIFIISLKLGGHNLGWGIHFQQPLFITILIFILIIFAANSLDFFHINLPIKLLNKFSHLNNVKENFAKNFFTGILITILATPCSAPFLGSAIGFALATSYLNIIMVFLAISIGLSFPYILLIIFPQILYLLPKPGKWMIKLKTFMALLLFITALWLLFVIKSQIGLIASLILVLNIIILFLLIKMQSFIKRKFNKEIFYLIFIINIILAMFLVFLFQDNNFAVKNHDRLNFKKVEISQLLQKHQGVFVNVTADWCLTCKINEKFILNSQALQQLFKEHNIVLVHADYTNRDPIIYEYLRSFNRYAIPTYIIYNKNIRTGKLLSELLTIDYIMKNFLEYDKTK